MIPVFKIFLFISAYLLGSIPTAVWVGKIFYSLDVRDFGSGNAGATNTFRVLGAKAGIPVLLFDILKGLLAVRLAFFIPELSYNVDALINFQLVLGVCALLGHIFPIFAGFRGGKGIASLLGMMLGILPAASLTCLGIFLIVFLSTRIVSVSSMAAAVCFPIIVIFIFKTEQLSMITFSVFIAAIVLITHRKNIQRLLRKEESKVRLSLRKRSASNDDVDELMN